MPTDIKARWQRLKRGQKAGIAIAAVFILVLALAFFAPASPAPTDSVMDAKIAALNAQTAALNAEAAALNKLTDDLKSKEPSWTILAATDPKWPFTVPKAVIRCEQDTSSSGGEVLTITANKTEYAFAFPMMDTGSYPLDTPIVKPGAANIHQADMYMYRAQKKLCRTASGH